MSEMFVCSTCGSPSVEFSSLVGGAASCKACGWVGSREGLASIPVKQSGLLDADQTFLAMYNDFRKIVRTMAPPLTHFLVQWGFVGAVQRRDGSVTITEPRTALRFVNAVFQGAFKSVLDTREAIEKERVERERPTA